jgi:hypothetical protein
VTTMGPLQLVLLTGHGNGPSFYPLSASPHLRISALRMYSIPGRTECNITYTGKEKGPQCQIYYRHIVAGIEGKEGKQ